MSFGIGRSMMMGHQWSRYQVELPKHSYLLGKTGFRHLGGLEGQESLKKMKQMQWNFNQLKVRTDLWISQGSYWIKVTSKMLLSSAIDFYLMIKALMQVSLLIHLHILKWSCRKREHRCKSRKFKTTCLCQRKLECICSAEITNPAGVHQRIEPSNHLLKWVHYRDLPQVGKTQVAQSTQEVCSTHKLEKKCWCTSDLRSQKMNQKGMRYIWMKI